MTILFNPQNPLATDPYKEMGGPHFQWCLSSANATGDAYYAWTQPVTEEVTVKLSDVHEIGSGGFLNIYKGPTGQPFIYRITFPKPVTRARIFPHFCFFWSFGVHGGPSGRIKYHYRDRFVCIHEWVDKHSFLAILRQQVYLYEDRTNFWSHR